MATEIRMPQFGVSMETGTIAKWFKAVGDPVKAGDVVASIETEKLTNDVISEVDGVMLAIVAQEGDELPIQGLMAVVGAPGETWSGAADAAPAAAAPAAEEAPAAAAPAAVPAAQGGRVKASPLARKVAAELGVDLSKVQATGTSGRIKAKDVYAYAESAKTAPAEAAAPAPAPAAAAPAAAGTPFPVKNLELMEGDVAEKMTGMRKVVAQRMYTSAIEIPTVTQTVKVDVTKLLAFRKELNEGREQRLSLNDFILKAVAKALRRNPQMLVSLDGEQIIRRAHVNLGMAVALDTGLIVPVIRDADLLGLEALSAKAKDLASRARSGQLDAGEYKGSTFTVSNLGMFGVESFTPIINQPDAAILGVNCTEDELVMEDDGTITKHQVLRISLTFDHRLLDGSDAARFQQSIRDLLESPMEILL